MNNSPNESIKIVSTNSMALKNYFVSETIEAGLVLVGTEIKSIRNASPNLRDSYVEIKFSGKKIEAWVHNMHIPHYIHGNIWNHEPKRPRKLLLQKKQIHKIFGFLSRDGLHAIPIKLYLKRGRAKIALGICSNKKKSDRREALKKRTHEREMAQALKQKR